MAETKRSGSGARGSQGRGYASRGAPNRKLLSRPGSVPRWAYVALIAVPAAGIVILLAVQMLRTAPEEVPKPADPNTEITDLEMQIPSLEKDYVEVQKLLRSDDKDDYGRGKTRGESLQERLYGWIERWDSLFDSKRDEQDRLPKELQGYAGTRARVNQLLSDLNRSLPF